MVLPNIRHTFTGTGANRKYTNSSGRTEYVLEIYEQTSGTRTWYLQDADDDDVLGSSSSQIDANPGTQPVRLNNGDSIIVGAGILGAGIYRPSV